MTDTDLKLARSNAEAHLFMALRPCPTCGNRRTRYRSSVVRIGEVLASRYVGQCPDCGAERRFEFRLPDEIPTPSGDTVHYGDDRPSELVDAGQWLAHCDDMARRVPADRSRLSEDEARTARYALTSAAASAEEVLKFIPPGADQVPDSAFWTAEGRAVRDREPGRFRAFRIRAVRDHYAHILEQWEPHRGTSTR
jgi:predicted  nucleic acid-binding Zn-ribbon protein